MRRRQNFTRIPPETPCSKNRASDTFAAPVYGPSKQHDPPNVVKTVDVVPSKRQRASPTRTANLLKLKGKQYRVSTGDPLGPRRCSVSCKSSLFSSTCKSRSWRRAVETCGALLKPEAPDSYIIIYIFRLWSSIHSGDQPSGDVRKDCLLPARSNCEVFPSRTDQAVVITVAVSVSKSSSLISSNVSRSSP